MKAGSTVSATLSVDLMLFERGVWLFSYLPSQLRVRAMMGHTETKLSYERSERWPTLAQRT